MRCVRWVAVSAAGFCAPALAQAPAPAPGGAVADLSAVMTSLAAVVAIILVAAFVVRRLPLGFPGKRSDLLKVVAQLPLGPRERLLLIEARGSELLIAVSPSGVFNVGAASDASFRGGDTALAEFRLGEPR